MAKASFLCGRCKDNYITVIGRSRKEADRKAQWLEDREVCEACKQVERDKENQASLELANERGWCELKGSEKQIAWANTIRRNKLQVLNGEIGGDFAKKETEREIRELLEIEAECVPFYLKMITSFLSQKDSASFWIDFNQSQVIRIVASIRAELSHYLITRDSELEEEESAALEELKIKVLQEETVKPEDPRTNNIVTLRFLENRIALNFEVKCEAFISLVKGYGFTWNAEDKSWTLKKNVFDGDFSDRAAEMVSILLEERYVVRCSNNEIRQKGIDGTWLPRTQRQVHRIDVGVNKGRLRFIWFDSKKMVEEFCFLPNAKKDYKCAYGSWSVSPVDYNQVLDFAETYGFKLYPSAIELINKVKSRITLIPTVKPKKGKHEYPEISDEIVFSDVDGIDGSLVDD